MDMMWFYQTFEVSYELKDEEKFKQIDVFLDGVYQKGFQGVLNNVQKGKHEILIKASPNDEEPVAAWDRVEIIVK